ncbi:NUDIX hydrolase [Marinobacterium sp. D7]|uniref:NUDIX hydrolase n=1 Tax=Marinobacterium ramblicola TaxID=2849041 RepID=UPI001C2D2995|nr:NUDIX hydrolase [Marinobacterium ramblicola]MBV1788053.1 NUDIX hydrolase [Marinobacterium ramblicola]
MTTQQDRQGNGIAVVVVIVEDGRVLVIRRSKRVAGAGYWSPPAGKVQVGEDQAAAVVREAWEELGLTVRPVRLVWECMADGADYRLYWWLAEPEGGSLRPERAEVAAVQWIRPDEFPALDRTFPKGRLFFEKILPALPEWQGRT